MNISRRSFLTQVVATTAVASFILPSRIRAADAGPNSLINMGFIGMGLQNRSLLTNCLSLKVKAVAVCDVDTTRREHALKMVEKYHGEHPEKGAFACKAYSDFREIIARKDIDAVCIARPDPGMPISRWPRWRRARTRIARSRSPIPSARRLR